MFEVSVMIETSESKTLKLLAKSHNYHFTGDGDIITLTTETKGVKAAKDKICHMLSLSDGLGATVLKQSVKKTIYDTELGIEFPTRAPSEEVPSKG